MPKDHVDEVSAVGGDLKTPERWYLLQVKPGGYSRAEMNLKRQGVTCFVPRQPAIPHSKSGPKPLFPGYLFAAFDPQKVPFRTVNATFGVKYIVTHGYNLTHGLPPSLVNGLKSRCDENGILLPPQNLAPGEQVRITSGPFAEFVATVEQLSRNDRLTVLFDLLGQTIRAELDAPQVVRV